MFILIIKHNIINQIYTVNSLEEAEAVVQEAIS